MIRLSIQSYPSPHGTYLYIIFSSVFCKFQEWPWRSTVIRALFQSPHAATVCLEPGAVCCSTSHLHHHCLPSAVAREHLFGTGAAILDCIHRCCAWEMTPSLSEHINRSYYLLRRSMRRLRQIFRIGTVRYAEGLRRMRRHGPVIAHCTDSEDFPRLLLFVGWVRKGLQSSDSDSGPRSPTYSNSRTYCVT